MGFHNVALWQEHHFVVVSFSFTEIWLLQWYTQHSQETILPIITFSNQLLAETMSDVSKSLVPTNIQELFLPLSRVHSYGTRASTSQNFYRKKSNLEIKKNSFSRLGAKLWNEIPNKLRTLSKHKLRFNIRASLLDILETCNTYYETDEFILKMKKAEPIFL